MTDDLSRSLLDRILAQGPVKQVQTCLPRCSDPQPCTTRRLQREREQDGSVGQPYLLSTYSWAG